MRSGSTVSSFRHQPKVKLTRELLGQVWSGVYWLLRKYAYTNILKMSPSKTENFQIKILIFFISLLKTKIVGTR